MTGLGYSSIASSSGSGGGPVMVTGRYYTRPSITFNTGAFAQSRLYLVPMQIVAGTTFDRIGFYVSSGTASSTPRLGLYADSSGAPDWSTVVDAGTVDASTTGFKEITINTTISTSVVWLAMAPQGATATGSRVSGSSHPPSIPFGSENANGVNGSNGGMAGLFVNSITGALPNTSQSTAEAQDVPAIFVRKA